MGYAKYSEGENIIGDPTIRILKPGTFKEYRHWKAETSGINFGLVLPKFCSELLRRTRTDRTEP